MRVWIIQPLMFWKIMKKTLQEKGFIYPDEKIVEAWSGDKIGEMFKYDFLYKNLEKHCPKPDPSIKSPFWLWIWYYGIKNARPDIRELRWHNDPAGYFFARLEFDIPPEKILPLSFERWLMLMSSDFLYLLPSKRKTKIAKMLKEDNIKEWHFPYPEPKYQKINQSVRKSWLKLFSYGPNTFRLAGLTWELRSEWFVRADEFTMDKRSDARPIPDIIFKKLGLKEDWEKQVQWLNRYYIGKNRECYWLEEDIGKIEDIFED